MENTSGTKQIRERDIHYYRRRLKNRVYEQLVDFFVSEVDKSHITKKDIAERLRREPSQITRWLSAPANLTLDTISDLLLALDAELDMKVVKFQDRPAQNYVPALIERIIGKTPLSSVHSIAKGAISTASATTNVTLLPMREFSYSAKAETS